MYVPEQNFRIIYTIAIAMLYAIFAISKVEPDMLNIVIATIVTQVVIFAVQFGKS